MTTPTHLLPERCFICGGTQHGPKAGHIFWTNAQAEQELAEIIGDATYDGGAAARYVAEYRPY